MRAIRLAEEFRLDDIEEVQVRTFHEASRLFSGMPENTSQAQYSLPFSVAMMLVHGMIGPQHIEGAFLSDDSVAELVEKIHVTESDMHNGRFPEGRWSDASILLKDGRILQSGDIAARGSLEAPMSEEEFSDKYYNFVGFALGQERAREIWNSASTLTASSAQFADFAELCHRGSAD